MRQSAESACRLACKNCRSRTAQQATDLAQKARGQLAVAPDCLARPTQRDQKCGTVSCPSLRQGFESCQVLFHQVRLSLAEVSAGLGDQQAKRSSANLGI